MKNLIFLACSFIVLIIIVSCDNSRYPSHYQKVKEVFPNSKVYRENINSHYWNVIDSNCELYQVEVYDNEISVKKPIETR